MSKVVLIAPSSRFDLNGIEKYGEVTYLLEGSERITPVRTEHLVNRFRERLEEIGWDPQTDYIAVTGNAASLFLLGLVAGDWLEGPYKILIFDSAQESYVVRIIDGSSPV